MTNLNPPPAASGAPASQIYLPMMAGGDPAPQVVTQATRIVVDPVTRIEGHLHLELDVANGQVQDAFSSGTMFRGIEKILQGRDPRQAWVFAQRLCGVCTTVHAIASVRAVENALGLTIPDNARLVRNILAASQMVSDHVIHFYHLHSPDWVDVPNALQADPAATSALAQSISDWPNSSPNYFAGVKARLKAFVNSGQLGPFANGYWGHPAYALPPAGNLLAVAHYLEALDWQREFIKLHAVLGGKNPHPQAYLVGGMAAPFDLNNPAAITPAKLTQLEVLAEQALNFVTKVYLPDLLLVASFYPDWLNRGNSYGNYLSFGDYPDQSGTPWLPAGVYQGDLQTGTPSALDPALITENVARAWYTYSGGNPATSLHPSAGETTPNYTGPQTAYTQLNTAGQYSWLKAPRYNGLSMEVGPLARMVIAYAAGHARAKTLLDAALLQLAAPASALFSTLGRTLARGVEAHLVAEQIGPWLAELKANVLRGNLASHNPSLWEPATWPAQASGWGATEAPRGALGHWVAIQNGQITNYQMIVPTTWNGSPRDAASPQPQRGAWEQALVGTPLADVTRPLEVLRTVHSFDPCMSCAVHVLDAH